MSSFNFLLYFFEVIASDLYNVDVFLRAEEEELFGEPLGQRELHKIDRLHEGVAGAGEPRLQDGLREVVDVILDDLLALRWGAAGGLLAWGDEEDICCSKMSEKLKVGCVMGRHDQVSRISIDYRRS